MKRIVIVGAGVSGLSLAFKLREKGCEVTLYEKESEAGGNIRTRSESGYLFELGPQTILADEKLLAFFRELGLKPLRAEPSSKNRFIYRDGRLIPLPLNPVAFLTSPLLSLRAKLRVLREPWIPPSTAEEESVADFVRRRLGAEFLDYIVAPFVSGVYAGDPEQLSVRYATRKVYALEREFGSLIRGALKKRALGPGGVLISFEGGLRELVERLSQELDVRRSCAVLSVRRKGEGFLLETCRGEDETQTLVLSCPAYATGQLLAEISGGASRTFEEIDYVPLVVVNVGVRSGRVPEGFGLLVPRREGKRILGVIFSSKLFPGRAPEGRDLLTVYLGGATDREVIDLSEEEITGTVVRELKDILSIEDPEFVHVQKWRRAIPQYGIGYGRYLSLASELEKSHRGLYLTGNYLSGVSVADCLRNSGEVLRRMEEAGELPH